MKQAYRECSRFERCSVNNCPLHELYPNLYTDPEDREKKCTMEKNVRIRIGANYPELKLKGYTQREYSAKVREDAMSQEDKQKRADRVKKYLFVSAVKVECVS